MSATALKPATLGPATEQLIAEAFRENVMLTADQTARLLGIDVRTLRSLTDDLVIRAVRVGKLRRYTEADIRAYLIESPAAPCRSIKRKRAATGSTTSNIKVVAFTDRPASKPGAKPRK